MGTALADPLDLSISRFDPPPTTPPASSQPLTLMFTGDTKLCERTALRIKQHGPDYPFALVAEHLRAADICFGNCETAITDHATLSPGKPAAAVKAMRAFAFKSDPAYSGPIFADAGFDILQLANNHAMDYCAQGLLDTMAHLDTAGVAHVGGGADYKSACAPRIVEANGVRVGFIAYSLVIPAHSAADGNSPGIAHLPRNYPEFLRAQVDWLRGEGCALVVAGFHWGVESTTTPNAQQRRVGRAAIDAGADIVIGTHPHSMQGVEFYSDGVIAYSLGNFVFTGASQRLAGCIFRVRTEPAADSLKISEVALLPCWINDGRPTPSNDQRLHSQLASIMRATGSNLSEADAGWLRIAPAS